MTKICVFSDTHGYAEHMLRTIRREKPDYVLFLGDGASDVETVRRALPLQAVQYVRGNCDLFDRAPAVRTVKIAGKTIFCTHGHLQRVKLEAPGFRTLWYAAREAGADVALFGHTHTPFLEQTPEVLLVNPGTAGRVSRPGYARLCIDGDAVTAELLPVPAADDCAAP